MPNVIKFSKALFALHQVDCLKNRECRQAVAMFVRQATETAHWNLTTHYRSKRAAEEIAKASIRSREHYHNWCKQNLRHEHMVPISEVIRMFYGEPNITEDFMESGANRGLRCVSLVH